MALRYQDENGRTWRCCGLHRRNHAAAVDLADPALPTAERIGGLSPRRCRPPGRIAACWHAPHRRPSHRRCKMRPLPGMRTGSMQPPRSRNPCSHPGRLMRCWSTRSCTTCPSSGFTHPSYSRHRTATRLPYSVRICKQSQENAMLELNQQTKSAAQRHLITSIAHSEPEVLEAQRLRYKVFAEEMGAKLPSAAEGIDRDIFDKFCDHLLVRDQRREQGRRHLSHPAARAGGKDRRLLFRDRIRPDAPAAPARPHGGSRPFLRASRLSRRRDHHPAVERPGRIHQQHGHEYLIGCASISMADGGHVAASVYNKLHRLYAAPAEYNVFPHCPLPLEALNQNLEVTDPAADQGLSAAGRLYLRRTGMGSGFQHRRPVHPDADVAHEQPLCQAFSESLTSRLASSGQCQCTSNAPPDGSLMRPVFFCMPPDRHAHAA